MPNPDVKSRGLNYTAIYFPYLSRCPLMASKTPYSIPIFKIKAYKVIAHAPYLYYDPKIVKEVTLS